MKRTLLLAYFSQLYVSLIGIVLLPLYLNYLGVEVFGLVGLYITLQAWMQVLDLGLTPVLSREMSRFRAGTLTEREAATRLRTLEVVQAVTALMAISLFWLGSAWISETWLSSVTLSSEMLVSCINLIGVGLALRWLTGLHRAVLTGLERQDLVNGLAVGFATLRFAGVVPLLIYVSASPRLFFAFLAIAGLIELSIFSVIAHRQLPGSALARPDWRAFTAMFPLVGSMAFLSANWVMVTQIDKLILSGLLPLHEYGYFMLAVAAASGVLALIPPLHQVLQPRMTILSEQGESKQLTDLYRLASQWAAIAFVGVGGGMAFFAEPVLRIWSGNATVANAVAPVLFWYGLANAVVGLLVLPFLLQLAKGDLRLHVLGNLILIVTLVPALVFSTRRWGAVGAGQVFFASNLLFLLLWAPFVHRRFMPQLNWRWLWRDILPIGITMGSVLAVAAQILSSSLQTPGTLAWIATAVMIAVALGIALGTSSRQVMLRWHSGSGE